MFKGVSFINKKNSLPVKKYQLYINMIQRLCSVLNLIPGVVMFKTPMDLSGDLILVKHSLQSNQFYIILLERRRHYCIPIAPYFPF